MKLQVASTVGQNSTLTVRDEVFGVKVNRPLIAQAIRVFLANQRQGTSKVKTRSEINRTKKKWFKQKGTGNARHGARTPSLFVGGGVAHGPSGIQNYTLKMSPIMRRRALASALSAQVANIIVSDDIMQLDGKTSSANKMLMKMLPEAKHVLVVLPKNMPMVTRSLRNLPRVLVTSAARLNTYEVAYADAIVFTKESVKIVEERLSLHEGAKTETVTRSEVVAKPEVATKTPPKTVTKTVTKTATKAKPVKKPVAAEKPKAKAASTVKKSK